MKIIVDVENEEKGSEIEAKRLKIALNKDVEFNIDINKFGELVIRKQNFGNGEGSIMIMPSVSNEIRVH